MNTAAAIYAVGSLGIFPSRAFVPALVTASLMRWGDRVPLVRDSEFFRQVQTAGGSSWFTHDITMVVLAVLAVLEILATKNADFREWMNEFDRYVKAAAAALTTLGVLSAADRETVQAIQQAGVGQWILPGFVAAGTYAVARLRGSVMDFLIETDADDDVGLQGLISWAEDIFVVFGLVLLAIYPLLILTVIALVIAGLFLVRKWFERWDEANKVPCSRCGQTIYAHALACCSCGSAVAQPAAVGLFGTAKVGRAADLQDHSLRLVQWHRCPRCASRLESRLPKQLCWACGERVNEDPAFVERYVGWVHGRLHTVLPACFAMSLVPVLGGIVGVIYYRMRVVMPYRQYIPFWRGFLARRLIGLLSALLLLVQLVPLVGGVAIPIMALISGLVHRRTFRKVQGDPKYALPPAGGGAARTTTVAPPAPLR